MPSAVQQRAMDTLEPIFAQGYGMTEASPLGLAPLDSVFADPVPKGARTDPEIAGDLNDRPSRLPDDPHSTGPELRVELASCV